MNHGVWRRPLADDLKKIQHLLITFVNQYLIKCNLKLWHLYFLIKKLNIKKSLNECFGSRPTETSPSSDSEAALLLHDIGLNMSINIGANFSPNREIFIQFVQRQTSMCWYSAVNSLDSFSFRSFYSTMSLPFIT